MTKRLTAILWVIASCGALWLFSLVQPIKSTPPTIPELIDSYILFSLMVIGGSASYHFFTELLSVPINENNQEQWRNMKIIMLKLMLSIISIPLVILVMRECVGGSIAYIVSYMYLLFGFILGLYFSRDLEHTYRALCSNN